MPPSGIGLLAYWLLEPPSVSTRDAIICSFIYFFIAAACVNAAFFIRLRTKPRLPTAGRPTC